MNTARALAGALVTIDAMGCQTKIAQAIPERGADYLLALKDNQPSLIFETPAAGTAPAAFKTVDADHGRIETRRHHVSHDADWLTTDRRVPGEPRFPGLNAITMVEATTARRYFLSSMPLDPRILARAVRAHRGIENRPHRLLDVVFHDDLMRLRTKYGPKNMATIKHMAMNIPHSAAGKDSLKSRRNNAAWNHNDLRPLVTQTAR